MTNHYFLKSGGKTLGPFSREQLDSLQVRGRIKPEYLISPDRKSWKPVLEFFGETASTSDFADTTAVEDEWYYADDQQRVGPLTCSRLYELLKNGTLSPDDLVWREGFRDWVPASSVPELLPKKSRSAVPRQRTSPSAGLQRICLRCGTQDPVGGEFCPRCGNRYNSVALNSGLSRHENHKDRIVAGVLALLLGGLGVHHFYLGNTLLGLLYLLFCWTFIPALVSFIEAIIFLCSSAASFDAKYNTHN